MERRRHKRIFVDLKASIISDDKPYNGFIENVSEGGIRYLIASTVPDKDKFTSNEIIDLLFSPASDQIMQLKCETVWSKVGVFTGEKISVGMKVIDPPAEYIAWIRSLYRDQKQ